MIVPQDTLLLASKSPRRHDLLRKAGIAFEIEAARSEELTGGHWTARELCLINAERKALEVASKFPERIVLGADTVVSLERQIFGKPASLREAQAMLERLCGRIHEVLTGVCLVRKSDRKLCRFVESTRVKFRSRQVVDLEGYLQSIDPLDKAGGYAAQEDNGRLIECIEGSMTNVIGLPIERVLAALKSHF
ncbi:MAG TPA: nucleoside triphosphate pyrophosphatase [Terrimicrobiaceae bacterium]|nr:nucleoside triphosphate pyrophosphatase [Terrimicrobiaceae bacterium]